MGTRLTLEMLWSRMLHQLQSTSSSGIAKRFCLSPIISVVSGSLSCFWDLISFSAIKQQIQILETSWSSLGLFWSSVPLSRKRDRCSSWSRVLHQLKESGLASPAIDLLIETNRCVDRHHHGWVNHIEETAANYPMPGQFSHTLLLKVSSWGDCAPKAVMQRLLFN